MKSSISGATVTNTLYRGSVALRAYDSSNHLLGATTLDASDGYGSIVNLSSDISYYVIAIPRKALPSSGKYKVMSDWSSDFSYSISNVRYRWSKVISSAQTSYGWIACGDLTVNNAGEFKDLGTYIDFSSNFTELRVHVNIADSGQKSIGGWFKMNLALDTSANAITAGTEYNEADNSATIVSQNEQIIEGQNETHGLLNQIIQHISDQLYALWDQIYNLMALPWKQEQHQDQLDTQESIDDGFSSLESHETSLFTGLQNFIQSLFIPDAEQINQIMNSANTLFSEKFGFFYYPIEFLTRIMNSMNGAQSTNGVISFPGIGFDVQNMTVKVPCTASEAGCIVPSQNVPLCPDGFEFLWNKLRLVNDMICVVLILNYCYKCGERALR